MIKVIQRGALRRWPPFIAAMLFGCCLVAAQAEEPSYVREVQPLLRKYCGGCHNEADREGDFSVANHAVLLKGTPDGPVIKPGDAAASRLLQLISGKVEPRMPPEDEAQPTPEQLAIIEKWIAAGAVSDADRVPLQEQMLAPKLRADAQAGAYVTAMIDAGPRWVAVAKYGGCEIRDAVTQQVLFSVGDLPGKINQLRLSPDGQYLMIATGIAGIGGQVVIVDCAKRTVVGRLQGHTDTIYAAAMSPDGKWIATGSYDRVALLWDWKNNKVARKFAGHNGAIYDVDIDPEGKVLATASADQTIKLWGLGDGNRLDTLGQPEGEMLCVRFTPDGRYVLGAGADRQLRLWELISKDRPAINPLRQSRFAHEDPVTQLVFRSTDQVVSLSEDRTVKLWQLDGLKPIGVVTRTEDIPTGVAKCSPGNDQLLVVDYAGNVSAVTPPVARSAEVNSELSARASGLQAFKTPEQAKTAASVEATAEAEPNSRFEQAQPLSLPARVQGVVADEHNGKVDVDWFVFEAKAGQSWVMEVNAARMKSPLDSLIDVLDDQGQPVLRTRLQAIRESYFTFRGKDSNTSDDFRLHKWQDMELNELLYAGGEVVKLWLYPRGPDSGFKVYPGFGARVNFFDTTATAHALGEQAFVVRELAVGEEPLPNGLPLFSIYYQNDDDAQRRWGKDSRLEFTAPSDGRYWLRVRDARGFGGDDYRYELTIRQPQPDFELEIKGLEMAMPRGSGREWQVNAKRFDGLAGPIEIHLDNLPSGFVATNPLVIEAGQDLAYGNLFATAEAQLPEGRDQLEIQLTARSTTPAGEVVHQLSKPLTVKLTEAPEVQLVLVDANDPKRELDELVIHPGETISAKVVIKRGDQTGPVGLGKEDSGRNLPHGSFVDNIGLNGLLIPDGTTEREFFIRAADWLEPQQRLFHLRSDTKNNPTSRSIRLRVVPK